MTDGGELDELLDDILRAAGSGLRHYTMQKSLDDMRVAVRKVYERGVTDGMEMMLYPGTPEEQRKAAERGRAMLERAQADADAHLERLAKALWRAGAEFDWWTFERVMKNTR